MTPWLFFLYGLALGGSVLVLGLALVALYVLVCWLHAGEEGPK